MGERSRRCADLPYTTVRKKIGRHNFDTVNLILGLARSTQTMKFSRNWEIKSLLLDRHEIGARPAG